MGSHNLLFGYRFLSRSDPKLNLGQTAGCWRREKAQRMGITRIPTLPSFYDQTSDRVSLEDGAVGVLI
jgi:hypothetical protein